MSEVKDYGEPWRHTPEIDWGFIQNRHKHSIARAHHGLYQDEAALDEHRKNGTDPAQDGAARIVACVNALAGMNPDKVEGFVEAVASLLHRIRMGSNYHDELVAAESALAALEGREVQS